MLPRKGLARVGPGLLSRNQMLATPALRTSTGSPRRFGTTLKKSSNGRTLLAQASRPSSRVGAATLLSSPAFSLASTRRFASTGSELWTEHSLDAVESSLDHIPQKVGYLAELGLDYGWGPTSVCQWILEHAHFTAGLSWGWSVVALAAVLRAAAFYPAILGQQESYKLQVLRTDPVYAELTAKMMSVYTSGAFTPEQASMARTQIKMLEQAAGVKKRRLVYPLLQAPFAFGAFKITRAMAEVPVPGLETQGFLWFQDLSVLDPYFILPCVSTITMVLSLKRTQESVPSAAAPIMKKLPWVIGPLSILVTFRMSALTTLYFACTAISQYMQTMLFFIPTVRTWLNLPPLRPLVGRTSGATYQAPRTVNTTARPAAGDEAADGSFAGSLKRAYKSARAMAGQAPDDPEAKQKNYAKQYEERRRKAEAEDFLARREASRTKKTNKKKGGRD